MSKVTAIRNWLNWLEELFEDLQATHQEVEMEYSFLCKYGTPDHEAYCREMIRLRCWGWQAIEAVEAVAAV